MASQKIFALDGSLQCGIHDGIAPEVMGKNLTQVGIKIISMYKQVAPMFFLTGCGLPTGMANIYEIDSTDVPKLTKLDNPSQFEPWLFDADTVEVFIHDGSVTCMSGEGAKLEETSQKLAKAGIEVLDSHKDNDGIVRGKRCGLPTGNINVHEIKAQDYLSAQQLGFSLFSIMLAEPSQSRTEEQGSRVQRFLFEGTQLDPGDAFPTSNNETAGLPSETLDFQPKLVTDLIGRVCRVIKPGEPVDTRFILLKNRANIIVDERNVIQKITFH